MTTYDNNCLDHYNARPALFTDRIMRVFGNLAARMTGLSSEIAARKRRRQTILALANLPENILQDIGWPDLYERQHRKDDRA